MKPSPPPTRILCLHLPNWPWQRLVAAQPELEPHAVALCDLGPRGARVVASSPRAARAGVRPGMPLAEARSLAPGLLSPRHDPAADREALEEWARRCERFSPQVGLEEGSRPDSLLLAATGLARLWGGERRLAEQVFQGAVAGGYRPRAALAHSVGAAWALAHFAEPPLVVLPAHGREALDALPLAALRLAEPHFATLGRLGIATIGQLRSLPRASLAARFGGELARRLDQCDGRLAELIVPPRPPSVFAAHCALEHPTGQQEAIERLVARLVEQVAEQLRQRRRGALELELRLASEQGHGATLRVGVVRPTAHGRRLLDLLRAPLAALRLPAAVQRIDARVALHAPLEDRPATLLPAHETAAANDVSLLLEQLASRLGADRVLRPLLAASPLPERAFRYAAVVGRRAAAGEFSAPVPAAAVLGPLHRPLRLLPRPRPLAGGASASPPAALRWAGGEHVVARLWGPERLETGWWRGASVRRDYYRVETTRGGRLWIFRRLADDRWFVHGEFA